MLSNALCRAGRFAVLGLVALTIVVLAAGLGGAGTRQSVAVPPNGAVPHAGLAAVYLAEQIELREAEIGTLACLGELLAGTPADLAPGLSEAAAEFQAATARASERFTARYEMLTTFGDGAYAPVIVPADFAAEISHPHFPLVPGRTLEYESIAPEGVERKFVTVLDRTIEIDGVLCRIVRTVETLDGVLVEESDEWFAAHTGGDIWCFGRSVRIYEDGVLESIEGSWRSGKRGARAGIAMKALPAIGDVYRLEYAPGCAEEWATVLATDVAVDLGFMESDACVLTANRTPLEPDEVEHKVYAPAVGLVREIDPTTGRTTNLVRITEN